LGNIPARNIVQLPYRQLLQEIKARYTKAEGQQIEKAFYFSHHIGEVELAEEFDKLSSVHIAHIIATEMEGGAQVVLAAMLCEPVENHYLKEETIKEEFDAELLQFIKQIHKTQHAFTCEENEDFQDRLDLIYGEVLENTDIFLIRIAENLTKMRFTCHFPKPEHMKIAVESSLVYVPITQRIGLGEIKRELDTLALKYLQPFTYYMIEEKMKKLYPIGKAVTEQFERKIGGELTKRGIIYKVNKRVKTHASIWRKMQEKDRTFEELHDVFAARIVVENDEGDEEENKICWEVYQIITQFYKPVQGRLHDWISNAKPNGYKSLHTTLDINDAIRMEIQIRTSRMHKIAEEGSASHSRYKENKDRAIYQKVFKEWKVECKPK